MKLAACSEIINKPARDDKAAFTALTYKFANYLDVTPQMLAEKIVKRGWAFTAWHVGGKHCKVENADETTHKCKNYPDIQHRHQDNFILATHIAVDFDELETLEQILENEFVQAYACLLYTTPSHTELSPRLRAVFQLDFEIEDRDYYRKAVQAVMYHFSGVAKADPMAKDPCRIFYGNTNAQTWIYPDNYLTKETVDALITDYQQYEDKQRFEAKAQYQQPAMSSGTLATPTRHIPVDVLDDASRAANGFVKACDELRWGEGYQEWLNYAVLARSLDNSFVGSNGFFFDYFTSASRQHPSYNRDPQYNEKKLTEFSKLEGKIEPFASWQLSYDHRTKKVLRADGSDPNDVYQNLFKINEGQSFSSRGGVVIERNTGTDGRLLNTKVTVNTGNKKTTNSFTAEELDLADDLGKTIYDASDNGNAETFIYYYGQDFLHTAAQGWFFWNGKYWVNDDAENILNAKVVEVFYKRYQIAASKQASKVMKVCVANSSRVKACVDMLKSKLVAGIDSFDCHDDFLNCKNGIVELKTGRLIPHDRDYRFTWLIQTDYKPQADRALWVEFLQNTVGNYEQVADYLQMSVGYSLTGETKEECLFYIFGPTRSGKGTFTEVLNTLLGKPLSTETGFDTFYGSRDGDRNNFDLAVLRAAHMVFASESERSKQLNPAKLKLLTGGNDIMCCFKHKPHFTYRPKFKIWLSSNWPLNMDADDHAAWGRVRSISFPHSHLDNPDKNLKPRLKTQKVLESVLAWAVEGAMKWYACEDGLQTPEVVKVATKQHRDDNDHVQMWINECLDVEDANIVTPTAELVRNYQEWCKINGYEPKGGKQLAITLRAKGFATSVNVPFYDSEGNRKILKGVQGLRLA